MIKGGKGKHFNALVLALTYRLQSNNAVLLERTIGRHKLTHVFSFLAIWRSKNRSGAGKKSKSQSFHKILVTSAHNKKKVQIKCPNKDKEEDNAEQIDLCAWENPIAQS